MDAINHIIVLPLGLAMNLCYALVKNYGFAIILFTLLSKVILLPVSIWVQKNSIKMVKMQPEINFLKARYFGDSNRISDEQDKIFKREKYNPFASIIPLIIQIGLLMGIIDVIYHPLNYLLHLDGTLIAQMGAALVSIGADPVASTIQLAIVAAVQGGAQLGNIPTEVLSAIQQLDLSFLGFNLTAIPSMTGGMNLWSPVIAGFSAWLLCEAQNRSNVLQSEQSNWNKYGMMAFSVLLSLYLGTFVPIGVAVYWTVSNLLAIVQLYILNAVINPRSYVDYEALEASKKELQELQSLGEKRKPFRRNPNARRGKADYKRFFSITNKHLVFYSETSGFYKYYQGIIENILASSNVVIHYITSDPEDAIFQLAEKQPRIKPYFIDEKRLITLMMKMDADIVVMTMPDLENMHIKRSYIKHDIEYIYIPHGMDSLNLTMRTGAIDHYDTIFCAGSHQAEEIRATEQLYHLPPKQLIEWGYCLLDSMVNEYQQMLPTPNFAPKILIAPSWQPDNIMDSCLSEILEQLSHTNYQVVVRPHPQHVRHCSAQIKLLSDQYNVTGSNVLIQSDFSANDTVFSADVLITDWSGIAYEFAYTTQKPVLFIDTPMKIINPEYEKISIEPLNITLRNEIGISIMLDQIHTIVHKIDTLFAASDRYKDLITNSRKKYVCNVGKSAEVGGKYIISSILKKQNRG